MSNIQKLFCNEESAPIPSLILSLKSHETAVEKDDHRGNEIRKQTLNVQPVQHSTLNAETVPILTLDVES
jgi:hypothetical protein